MLHNYILQSLLYTVVISNTILNATQLNTPIITLYSSNQQQHFNATQLNTPIITLYSSNQ